MKGISTIIAAIILVVITIGLIATAYLYFMGIVTVGPVVSVASAYCQYFDSTLNHHNVTLTLRNDGTSAWAPGDLTFMWDGVEVGPFVSGCDNVKAGEVGTCVFKNATGTPAMPSDLSGTHTLNVYGPRNTAGGPITC